MIGIVDYGSGNYSSIQNALTHLGYQTLQIQDVSAFENATHLILPGVGAFGAAMEKLRNLGLIEPLVNHLKARVKPFLGICVGMQILANEGRENGVHKGIGAFPGTVRLLPKSPGIRLPHIGWNDIFFSKSISPLFEGIELGSSFYFVHSFYFDAAEDHHVLAKAHYGEEFPAAIGLNNHFGVQFHPEKSQRNGLKLLDNFCQMVPHAC